MVGVGEVQSETVSEVLASSCAGSMNSMSSMSSRTKQARERMPRVVPPPISHA